MSAERKTRILAKGKVLFARLATWIGERLAGGNTTLHHLQSKTLIWLKEASGYRPVRLFRSYSAFTFVVISALLVAGTNVADGEGIVALFQRENNFESGLNHPLPMRLSVQTNTKDNLSLVPLATQSQGVDPAQKTEETVLAEASLSPEHQMFLASTIESARSARDPEEDGGVRIYTVQSGDTVSGIAARNGITVNTILWANDLDNVDSIRPGDQIFILPVAGFKYIVRSGDTLDSIVSKYQTDRDRVIAYNGLPANGELTAGEEIILPDGVKDTNRPTPSEGSGLARRQYATLGGTGSATDITPNFSRPKEGRAGAGHRFPYGYCTWYVAQKRYVPWRGNAGAWLFNARAFGYKTGRTPAVGSIVVTTENRYYGHVALVEKVTKDSITVSEMNYTGWAKKSVRQLAKNSRVIRGYIY